MLRLWERVIAMPGDFTIDDLCRVGANWRNAQVVLASMVRRGQIEVVRTEPRGRGNRANVYRVIPPADRERVRRRARRVLSR